eukprot:746756-Hanusia_phi.AAC.9
MLQTDYFHILAASVVRFCASIMKVVIHSSVSFRPIMSNSIVCVSHKPTAGKKCKKVWNNLAFSFCRKVSLIHDYTPLPATVISSQFDITFSFSAFIMFSKICLDKQSLYRRVTVVCSRSSHFERKDASCNLRGLRTHH